MKLLFISSYQYPAYPAQFKHGALMAKEYAKLLKEDFLYMVLHDRQGLGVPIAEINRHGLPLRRFRLITLYYFFYLGLFLWRNPTWRSTIITQESKLAYVALLWRKVFAIKVIYECHGLHSFLADGYVCRHADKLIFVTKATEIDAKRFGAIAPSLVLPNGSDPSAFEEFATMPRTELRRSLGLPQTVLVGYIGRFVALGTDKGIETALRAIKGTDTSVLFCFVGGTPQEIEAFAKKAKHLGVENRALFISYQTDAKKIAAYTAAMDVLMYIPPPTKFFMEETSPMKLYEYMSAKRPIIVSDFKAMREILDESCAYFTEPTPEAFAKAVAHVLASPDEAHNKANAAYARVAHNTWGRRAEQLIQFIHA
jgi:glycosyltransferase involved in cell wall biosynthesis